MRIMLDTSVSEKIRSGRQKTKWKDYDKRDMDIMTLLCDKTKWK